MNYNFAEDSVFSVNDKVDFPIVERKGLWIIWALINNPDIELQAFGVRPKTKDMPVPHEFGTVYSKEDIDKFFPSVGHFLNWFPSDNFGAWVVKAAFKGDTIYINGMENSDRIQISANEGSNIPDLAMIISMAEKTLNDMDMLSASINYKEA